MEFQETPPFPPLNISLDHILLHHRGSVVDFETWPSLVGGWTTHLKNMLVKMGSSFPNRGENSKKYLSCHHLDHDFSLNHSFNFGGVFFLFSLFGGWMGFC